MLAGMLTIGVPVLAVAAVWAAVRAGLFRGCDGRGAGERFRCFGKWLRCVVLGRCR